LQKLQRRPCKSGMAASPIARVSNHQTQPARRFTIARSEPALPRQLTLAAPVRVHDVDLGFVVFPRRSKAILLAPGDQAGL